MFHVCMRSSVSCCFLSPLLDLDRISIHFCCSNSTTFPWLLDDFLKGLFECPRSCFGWLQLTYFYNQEILTSCSENFDEHQWVRFLIHYQAPCQTENDPEARLCGCSVFIINNVLVKSSLSLSYPLTIYHSPFQSHEYSIFIEQICYFHLSWHQTLSGSSPVNSLF